MIISVQKTDFMESNVFLLLEEKHGILIDPSDLHATDALINQNEIMEIDNAIITHEHCDHCYECEQIRKKYHCELIASEKCSENMKSPRRNLSQYYDALITVQGRMRAEDQKDILPFSAEATHTFTGSLCFIWQDHQLELRETPGHCPGSICVLVDGKFLFSGDSLIWHEKPNTRFVGGSEKDYQQFTLPWLYSLPQETAVYPGHGINFILGDQLQFLGL